MIELIIDRKRVKTEPEGSVLEAASGAGIAIPTLCHHPAVAPSGSCRMCVVEVRAAPGEPWRVAPSCLEKAREGMEVRTSSPDVRLVRQTVLELLLGRAPGSPALRSLGIEYGVDLTRFPATGDAHGCIVCGLCTRVCDQAGFSAISLSERGPQTKVGGPFGDAPRDCTGCAACAQVCPTSHIAVEEERGERRIWGRAFEVLRCRSCGVPTLTREQAEAGAKKLGVDEKTLANCPSCNRKATAATFARVMSLADPGSAAQAGGK